MKRFDIKKCFPHIVAVALFFILTAVYFAPVFQGKDLLQGDAISSQAWGKDAKDYHDATGEYAYWSNSMFSGMPANYTFAPEPVNIFESFDKVLTLRMFGFSRRHIGSIFLTFVCFYIFLLSLGCKPWLSIAGSIAYTLCSYNLIIIGAGHMNKSLVMATMAPIIGGVILCYRGKLLWGALVTLIFSGLNIYWSHQQISYYLLMTLLILAIVYLVYAIKEGTLKQYFKSSAVMLAAAVLAALPAIGQLLPSADYAKDTMRGGAVLKQEGVKESSGLDIDYAFQWSYGKAETFTLLVPNLYGGASGYDLGTDSETYRIFSQAYGPRQAAEVVKQMPAYWGPQPGTSGPVYVGAVVCLLFVFGIFVVRGRERWWLVAATILSFVLSWGRFLPSVNSFLFYNLPLYSKFRAPSMALVIASLTMVTLGILAVKRVVEANDEEKKMLRSRLLYSAAIVGGILIVFALFGGSMFNFSGASDAGLPDVLVKALRADRESMFIADVWRSFTFVAVAAALLYIYLVNRIKRKYMVLALALLFLFDLWSVDKRFLSYDDFMPKRETTEIRPTEADRLILQDKDPNYRVLNLARNTFNESYTSYFHKSIGGYSPAKMRRYQDIIDYYLSRSINPNVINMLNTRYVIVPGENGEAVQYNPEALGNCWFVDRIEWVDNPNEEIEALADCNPLAMAFIDKEWLSAFENPMAYNNVVDSSAYIKMTDYKNPGNIFYESYSPNAQLAVFSEVYYKTWKAFVDGKEVKPVRANYILRALPLPAGKHTIEFRCVDELMIKSGRASLYASILAGIVIVLLAGAIIYCRIKQ
ncbi:MAG: hypothetical protein IKV17_05280 [Bacteroidaceae bacterium]|nr:hypothetical protein [Bacteroidaceae bacterium]